MVVVFEVALTKSTGKKEKDMQRKLKSGILELVIKCWSGKMRSFWELK